MKETAVFDKPYVKKSALIGTEDLPASFNDELKSFSRRDLKVKRLSKPWSRKRGRKAVSSAVSALASRRRVGP